MPQINFSTPTRPASPLRIPRWPAVVATVAAALAMSVLLSIPAAAEEAVSVPESEALRAVAAKVDPAYPPMAKQMKIGGKVQVTASVDTDGSVDKVEIVSGNAILANACVSAVKRWKFSPFQNGGKASKANVHLSFTFNIQ